MTRLLARMTAAVITAVMLLSLLPAVTLPAYAAPVDVDYPDPSEDFWSVWRSPEDYMIAEGESYLPAAGYNYNSEGFVVISPDFGEYSTRVNVQTSRPVDLKEGFFMEVRIDDFSYKGDSGIEDEWVSFAISDERAVGHGYTAYSNNWLNLIRGEGNGQAINMPLVTVRDSEDSPGSISTVGGFAECVPEIRDGREVYTFEVVWDGSAYILKVNGCPMSGDGGQVSKHLLDMDETYVSVTLHSSQKGGKADFTITKQGTSASNWEVPAGSDSRAPEQNLLVYGDLIDPATVPENMPALILDGSLSSVWQFPTGNSMTLIPTASNGFHVEASGEIPYLSWEIKNELTYNAGDFPVFVMMLKDYLGNDGGVYLASGDVVSYSNSYQQGWSQWDDNARFYGENDEYTYVVTDLGDMIAENPDLQGRLHRIRPYFSVVPNDDDMNEWNIEFLACFRSIEEARAYGDQWVERNIFSEPETPPETPPWRDETVAPEPYETAAPEPEETPPEGAEEGDGMTEPETAPESVPQNSDRETRPGEPVSPAPAGPSDPYASVRVAFIVGALLLAVVVAIVAFRKK